MHPFFTYTEEPDAKHGRIDCRTVDVYPVEPIEAALPGARTLVLVKRTNAAEEDAEPELAYYHASENANEQRNAKYFAQFIRGHWAGCEIRNHWVRDAQMLEDRTRIRNYKINANLAAIRCCLIAVRAQLMTHLTWPQIIETAQRHPSFAYQAISNHALK